MGSRNALVTVLLSLLVVGAAGAWLLTRGGRDASGRSESARSAAGGREAAAARPDASLAAPGDLVADPPRGAERVEFAAEAPLPKGLAAPAAAEAVAELGLHGRVIDPFGRPIAGAAVYASDRRGFPLDFVEGPDAPPFARRATAQTDAEGRYELKGLSSGELRMLVRASGFGPHEEEDIAVPGGAAFELEDVVLQPGAILEGLVVDADGAGVGGANLYFEETGEFGFRTYFMTGLEQIPAAVTDPAGRFRIDQLALGAWSLRVSSPDHPERTFEGLAERAGEVLDRRFELERADVIAGRVLNVPEAERGKLKVRAGPPQGGGFFPFASGYRDAPVGPDGDFFIKGLRMEQDYSLQVRKDEVDGFRLGGFGATTRSERVPVRSGTRGVELFYQPEAGVVFQAVDARTEAPVTSFQIQSGFRWREPFMGEDGRPVDEFPEGRARVGNLRPDSSPAALELEITAVGYETYERTDVQIFAGRDTDLGVIRLKPLPLVEVTVLDASTGAPIAGAEVTLEEEQDEEPDFPGRGFRARTISIDVDDGGDPVRIDDLGRADDTDEQGVARLTSLEGKRGTLRVTRDGYAPQQKQGLLMPPGETVREVMKLGLGGAARVRVVDEDGNAVAGARVDHRSPAGGEVPFAGFFRRRSAEEGVTDAAGEILFKNLEPGAHRFRLERPEPGRSGPVFVAMDEQTEEPGWQEVEVAEGAESALTLVQSALSSLAGRVRESGVELAGATVRIAAEREGAREGWAMAGFGGGEGERTDSAGRYEIADLEPGSYTLTVSHPKRRMPMDFKVDVKAGENRFDVDLSVAIIEGRITNEQGKPLSGVEVRARKASSGGGPRARAMIMRVDSGGGGDVVTLGDDVGDTVHTDAEGNYSLRGVATDVELEVRASGEGVQEGRSAPVTVGPDQVRRGVDLKLEAAGSVLVEAFKPDGSKAEFVMVRATYLDPVPPDVTSSGADPKFSFLQSGSTSLAGMRPGRWSVTAEQAGPGANEGGGSPAPKEVVVAAGETGKVSFDLP